MSFAQKLPVVVADSGTVRTMSVALPGVAPGNQYSLLYSLDSLSGLGQDARVEVVVRQGAEILVAKTLHAGDADFYTQFHVARPGATEVSVKATSARGTYHLQVNRWPLTAEVKSSPGHRWQDAQKIAIGGTVFAHGDEAEYVPLPGTARAALIEDPASTDWYRFDFADSNPKLVFFQIELMERDQIPVNVTVFHVTGGKAVEYLGGVDPVTKPHEVQALEGNKFTTRVLREAGTYYVAVRSAHPEYKLVTRVYDLPPYSDPKIAVRTALDYILAAGDSWHANTPRRGGILDRISTPHQETSLCVGCHTTHFPQRAQLYALRNGYPVVQREELKFLAERFYNNPRPFYGFEAQNTVWSRVISAPANVLGRMSHLMSIYEDQVTGASRPGYHEGIVQYLNLYYKGRDKLPADETNGNTPLVSAHEVAWYAWTETKDQNLPGLVAKGEVKNVTDLCYQTLALADMDREKFHDKIQKNVERLFALQRPDGQWSYKFEADQPEVEFQTGHVLWTLHEARVPLSDPHVAKAAGYLLGRQQEFGGWFDPLQSFENFRTPFRETQFAIMGLAAYYPLAARGKGWNSPVIDRLSKEPVRLLEQLDEVWDRPSPEVLDEIRTATRSNDVLIRQAAAEALGRLGDRDSVLLAMLADPSKMVQRTAAWAVRQSYNGHPDTPSADLLTPLSSTNDRARWGAARVFSQHFSALARRPEFEPALAKLLDEPALATQMMGIKAIWQFWFWTPDTAVKSKIEDVLLAKLEKRQPAWIESNLHDAIYNFADENIRYLYNNWIPLLAEKEDRDRAIQGRLSLEARLAGKFAAVLDQGPDFEKKELLRFLTEFPLRRADVYDLSADLNQPSPPIYNRIGNDIEQVVFFGASAERIAHSLAKLLDSKDPELRHLAARAVLLVRKTGFGGVNQIAGPTGPEVRWVTLKVESMAEEAEVELALNPPPPASNGRAASAAVDKPTVKLDEPFFKGYVQPILERKGKDGYACAQCHDSHAIFRATYETALKVVDPAHPEDSLLLRKPTSSSESEGLAGTLAHGGGVRFTKDSPEYTTILDWIKGAKE
jgi:HEAT repeat protein